MKLQDGDCRHGRFVTPSGMEIKSFSGEPPLPPEKEIKVHYLGSLKTAAEVFASFDEQKKEVLRSMKFQGVLSFARFPSLDLYFCLWLMTRLDSGSCSIRMSGCEEIPIRDSDVGRVLEIPCYGEEVTVDVHASPDAVRSVMKVLRKADKNANISMGHFMAILRKDYGAEMTSAEVDAFKIAVVLFTMANVLATAANPELVPIGLLKFLTEPSKIHTFNWGLLVRRYMVSWGHLIQQQLRLGNKSITIGGCLILPVVTYLDNVILGGSTMLHYEFPRSGVYNCQILSAMIAADTKNSSDANAGRLFGNSELKDARHVFYGRWLVDSDGNISEQPKKRKAGSIVNEMNEKMKKHKGLVAKLVLLEANKSRKSEIIRSTGLSKGTRAVNNAAHNGEFPDGVIATMDAFIEELRLADTTSCMKYSEFSKSLMEGNVAQMNKTWLCHLEPFPIKLNGCSLALQLLEGGRYSTEVCDAILRDQVLFEDGFFCGVEKRERHLMPASFLTKYRERDNKFRGLEQLRSFFMGDHVKYSVTDCIQINMAVSSRRKWSCYSWNLKARSLTVLDPLSMQGPVAFIKRNHADIVAEINCALFSCLEAFFPGYDAKANEWRTIYRNDISDKCKWSDTGLYSMHYALTFNTDDITEEINWELDFMGRWRSLWRILGMVGNVGELPELFKEILHED